MDQTGRPEAPLAAFAADPAPLQAPVETCTPPPSGGAASIFFGRFGLRAGYGILIFIVVFILVQILAGGFTLAATHHLQDFLAARSWNQAHPHGPKHALNIPFSPEMVILTDGLTFLGLFAACWFFHKGERRPLRAYGVGSYRIADIIPGAFWGLVLLSAVVGVLRAAHLLVFDGQNDHGIAIFTWGFLWLVAFLAVGFSEEYTFRGYVQYTLMRGVWGLAESISPTHTRAVAFWISACIWSAVFGLAHTANGGENFFGLVQVFLAGIAFAYALWRTGSLWWGIGFHMTWDWAQSYLFGVADSGNISIGRLFVTHPAGRTWLSGGSDGPEGSIFASVALLLTIAVIHFTARPGTQPALEQEPMHPAHEAGFHSSVA